MSTKGLYFKEIQNNLLWISTTCNNSMEQAHQIREKRRQELYQQPDQQVMITT